MILGSPQLAGLPYFLKPETPETFSLTLSILKKNKAILNILEWYEKWRGNIDLNNINPVNCYEYTGKNIN